MYQHNDVTIMNC